jgi:predicted TIM-barrel fold metal-dependent hydrolase
MAHIPGMLTAAKKFPSFNFICAHSTWGRVHTLVKQKNIFFDIATSHHDAYETQLDRLVKEAGEDRILYACDAQLMHPAWTLGKIASYSFKDATLKKIFMANAMKAFPRLK